MTNAFTALPPLFRPAECAHDLVDRAEELAAGLTFGAAGLLDRRVALFSQNEDDFLLGRLLNCYGARVVCFLPRPAAWQSVRHGAVLRELLDILAKNQPGLDLGPLRRWREQGFAPDDVWQLGGRGTTVGGPPFDVLFAVGVLPAEREEARAELERLGNLVSVGGELEVLDTHRAPLPAATVRRLVENAGLIRLGLRSIIGGEPTAPEPRSVRLSFIRVAAPLHEYPVEGREHAAVLAHCRARLDFAAEFVAGADVLEAGAATGIGARLFLERGAHTVVGFDRAGEALDLGRHGTPEARVRFVQGDLNQPLPFADASFDVVVCLEVLEHITNQELAVAEFQRVLRPGGRLIVSVPDPHCEDGWAAVNRFRNPYHLRVIDRTTFLALLQDFAHIDVARQTEVVGAVVTRSDDPRPVGEFTVDAEEATRGPAMVQIAVCTKAPVTAARPLVCRLRLRAYENYSARHLELARHHASLYRQLVEVRHHQWQALNRQRDDYEFRMAEERQVLQDALDGIVRRQDEGFRLEVELLARCGGVVVSRAPLEPGRWSALMAEVLRPREDGPVIGRPSPRSPFLALHIEGQALALAPVPEHEFPIFAVVFPVSRRQVGLFTLRRWLPHFVQEFWFFEADGWQRVAAPDAFPWPYRLARSCRALVAGPLKAALTRPSLLHRLCRGKPTWQLSAPDVPTTPHRLEPWRERIEADNGRLGPERTELPAQFRVVQYIGTLNAGGAERQLVNLSLALRQRGQAARVLTMLSMVGDRGEYQRLLAEGGVRARAAARQPVQQAFDWRWLQSLPEELREYTYRLTTELLRDPPDVLHCWLDQANITGAIAGLVADVPRIVLGFRASNPTHFPPLFRPYLLPWYQLLAKSRRVQLLANSHSAASSYAGWIGIPEERVHVVRNGIFADHFCLPTGPAAERPVAPCGWSPGNASFAACSGFRLRSSRSASCKLSATWPSG